MINYKIKVKDEAESKEAQELFFELGYAWPSTGKKVQSQFFFLIAYSVGDLNWNTHSQFETDDSKELTLLQLRDLVAQSKLKDLGLISGADVPRLIKDGQQVQLRAAGGFKLGEWKDLVLEEFEEELTLGDFINSRFEWRLKPQTIKLELEIPAPFEPKDGDVCFTIDSDYEEGVYEFTYREDSDWHKKYIQFGVWDSLDKAKKVVAALRSIKK